MERVWLRIAAGAIALGMLVAPCVVSAGHEATIEELKARVANANVGDRPPLCIHIAEKQLEAAVKLYAAGDSEKAQASLTDVAAFAELARDYAIQSHKHEKPSEIALRKMTRKLADFKHTVSREDQDQVQSTIDKLERARNDLLLAMFPKGGKK